MKIHAHHQLDVLGPIVERMAHVAAAHVFGHGALITEDEHRRLKAFYRWLFLNTRVYA